jgi:hypothetical protein
MSATSRTERPQGKKTRQSGIPNRTIRFPRKQPQYLTVKDCCSQDSSNTSLVSSRLHAQPEEEDLVDEGTKNEGRIG